MELLDWLHARGVPKAVATSASRAHRPGAPAGAGLNDRFVAVITRDDVASCKPDPESFLRAAAMSGTAPAWCLAVEDSLPGMRSAMSAGNADHHGSRPSAPACAGSTKVRLARDLHNVRALLAGGTEPTPG